MAFYHVGQCSCTVGSCHCGVDYGVESFISDVNSLSHELTFKVKERSPVDARRFNLVSYNRYWHKDKDNKRLLKIIDTPSVEAVLDLIVIINEEVKNNSNYSVKYLKRGLRPILNALSDEDINLIDKTMSEYFSYTIVKSDW